MCQAKKICIICTLSQRKSTFRNILWNVAGKTCQTMRNILYLNISCSMFSPTFHVISRKFGFIFGQCMYSEVSDDFALEFGLSKFFPFLLNFFRFVIFRRTAKRTRELFPIPKEKLKPYRTVPYRTVTYRTVPYRTVTAIWTFWRGKVFVVFSP